MDEFLDGNDDAGVLVGSCIVDGGLDALSIRGGNSGTIGNKKFRLWTGMAKVSIGPKVNKWNSFIQFGWTKLGQTVEKDSK